MNVRPIAHAMLGAALGLFTSIIFLLLYYGTHYDIPVSDTVRFKSAFWDTILIVIALFAVLFYRDIVRLAHENFGKDLNDYPDE